MTQKSSSQSHPITYMWVDELIVSSQDIADPGAASADRLAPTSPTQLSIR